MRKFKFFLACSTLFTACAVTAQPVEVQDPWARASVAGQKATGVFMKLTAREAVQLVGGESPVAGVTEVHEMKMEGDVMRMRAVTSLPLAAGQSVELKPGSYHVMLMDLKQPLQAGSTVPLTLRLKDSRGTEVPLQLQVPVRAMATSAAPARDHDHGQGHGMHKH